MSSGSPAPPAAWVSPHVAASPVPWGCPGAQVRPQVPCAGRLRREMLECWTRWPVGAGVVTTLLQRPRAGMTALGRALGLDRAPGVSLGWGEFWMSSALRHTG